MLKKMRSAVQASKRRTATFLGLLLGMTAFAAAAQPWPSQPVRLVVPYLAGGAMDIVFRLAAPKMSERLGQPVVIDNRGGANANLGPDIVGRARADGYTLLGTATYFLVNPLLEDNVNWRAADFRPIARAVLTPNVLTVSEASPFRSLAEFVAAARAHPDLAVASTGRGAPQSIVQEFLSLQANVKFNVIPYRGVPPIISDILNGNITMSVLPLGAVLGAIQNGQLRAIAITSSAPSSLLPGVPSVATAGFPDIVLISWFGLHAPAGVSDTIVNVLADAVRFAMNDEDVRRRATQSGYEVAFLGTAEFGSFLDEDRARWNLIAAALKRR